MSIYLRPLFFCLVLLYVPSFAAVTAPSNKKVAAPTAPALPATLDVVTFVVHSEGANRKLIITDAPTVMRVDKPEEAYSLIYDPKSENYTGLEHSNYTYWQFSWPEIRAAVESSKRYASHLQEMNLAGINTDTPPTTTNAPTDGTATNSVPDTSGYVWRQTNDHKNIAGLNCVHWIGETVNGDSVQAWCFNGPLPKVQTAVDRLQMINEPMELVAIRSTVPAFVFPVFYALTKGGVTPVLITWGADHDKASFAFIEAKTRPTKPELFTVPKLYMKTTLVSMDGLIDQTK